MIYFRQNSVRDWLRLKLGNGRGVNSWGCRPGLLAGAAILVLLAGCVEEANQYAPPPPPEVTVALPKVMDVVEYRYFTGQTAANAEVELRARVKGFLQEIHFGDGFQVNQGDLLFTIDPREYEAEVAHANAELLNAQTALDFAENSYQRVAKAGKAKAIAELEVIKARADRDKAKADVSAAEAALQQADLNLSYTQIYAPIGGRVSRRQVDTGNLVGAEGSTVLTDIVNVDPVYVYVSVSEREVVRLLRKLSRSEGAAQELSGDERQPFELALATEEGFPHAGELTYLDNRVDPETGTIQVRGELANPDYLIIPGLFARIRIPVETKPDALLVPEQALGIDQAGRYLLLVDENNIVDRRSVATGAKQGDFRLIESGLEATDRVVVKGLLRARPGSEVKPVTVAMDDIAAVDAVPPEKEKDPPQSQAESDTDQSGETSSAVDQVAEQLVTPTEETAPTATEAQ